MLDLTGIEHPGILVSHQNDVATLQRMVLNTPGNLELLRSTLRWVLEEGSWLDRLDGHTGARYQYAPGEFRKFVTDPLPKGLSSKLETVRLLLRDTPELALFDTEIAKRPGGSNNPGGLNQHKDTSLVNNNTVIIDQTRPKSSKAEQDASQEHAGREGELKGETASAPKVNGRGAGVGGGSHGPSGSNGGSNKAANGAAAFDPPAPSGPETVQDGPHGDQMRGVCPTVNLGIPFQDGPKAVQGNSQEYAHRKLAKERPDLFAKVMAGELSAHRAMIEAGFRRELTLLEQAKKLVARMTAEEKVVFRRWLDEQSVA
jgi:hypothetical protein